MDKPKTQMDYLNWAGQLWQRGMDVNLRLWRDAMEGFYGGRANQPAMPDMGQGAQTMLKAYEAYVQLTMRYAEDVVKLGLKVSEEMGRTYARPAQRAEESTGAAAEAYVIRLAGKAGEAIHTSFSLESSESAVRNGRMQVADFIREETGKKASRIKATFKPASFTLQPGASQTIELKLESPKNQAAGIYRSSVSVDGFEDASFHLLLELEAAAKASASAAKKKK